MKKSWVITASAFIIVGLIGLMFAKFEIYDEKLVGFEHEFEFGGNMTIEDFTILGSSNNINVQFVPSKDEKTLITIEGKEDLLVIERIRQASLVDGHFILDLGGTEKFKLLSIGFEQSKINITASIPESKMLNQLNLNMKSGNIKVNDLMAKLATIEVNSGEVDVNKVEVDSLVVTAKSGNIDIAEQKGDLAVTVSSGNVTIEQLSGSSEIQATSGRVKLVQHDDQGATITAKSGNVEVTQHKPSNANIEVNSGNVKLKVAEDFAGYFDLKVSSGNIDSPESARLTDHLVKIRTTSGNIKVSQ